MILRGPSESHISLLTGLLLAVLLAGAGCSKEPSLEVSTAAPEAAASRHGGILVMAILTDPKSFNPVVAKETSTTVVTGLIFEGLTRTNGVTTEVEPALAESWEVSENGLRWTFHLRPGVLWSDGVPLTASDVTFTFERLIYNSDIPASARDIFTIEGTQIAVRAVDSKTVEFILPVPFAPFLRALNTEILPAHRVAPLVEAGIFTSSWGLDVNPEEVVGTGPFKLDEHLSGQYVRLVRNPKYWGRDGKGESLPYLDEVWMLIVTTQDVALLKFQEGALDLYSVRGSDYPILKPEEEKGSFTIYEAGPAFGTSFIFFNQNQGMNDETGVPYVEPHKLAWFTDLRFRQAVAHAIDKQSLINIVMNGLGFSQEAAMSPSAGFFHNPNVLTYPYDLDRARALLAEAGFVDSDGDGVLEDAHGNPLEFSLFTNSGNTERVQIATIIRKDLEQVGMKVHFTQLEFNNLVAKLNATYDWDAILLGLTGGIEPHFGKNVWYSSGHLHMWYPKQEKPATPWEAEIDRLFDAGVQELDPQKRKQFYDRWQVIVTEELPLIYTVLPPSIIAVRNRFGNLKPTSYGGALHNIEELYVIDGR